MLYGGDSSKHNNYLPEHKQQKSTNLTDCVQIGSIGLGSLEPSTSLYPGPNRLQCLPVDGLALPYQGSSQDLSPVIPLKCKFSGS